MSESMSTYCDHCNKGQTVMLENVGRGYIQFYGESEAVLDYGWNKTDLGVMCVDCQDERSEEG